MKKIIYLLALTVLIGGAILIGGVAIAQTKSVTVNLKNAQGQSVGTATISSAAAGVKIQLNLKNLPPGEHGIHIHQAAQCDATDFNPDGKQHGTLNPQGPHAGDLMNFTVAADGTAKATLTGSMVNMGADSHSIFTNGGTALVIHAKADDMKTDPSGNSGDRIACGVITK
jgi:superoxide dismutase, Cu-Zn family